MLLKYHNMKKLLLTLSFILAMVFGFIQLKAQEMGKKTINLQSAGTKDFQTAPKKVFLKNFKVYYQMIAEAEKTTYGGRQLGGGSYTGNATARLAVGVEGVDPVHLQELTNDIYNDYKSRLESMGFEVLTSKDVNIEFFEGWELLEGPRINQEQIEGSLMVIPDGFNYYVRKVKKSGKEKSGAFMGGVVGESAEFASAIYGPLPKVSGELDDMTVIEVILNVPSIYLDPKSRLGTAKVKGGPYLRLSQGRVTYGAGKSNKPGVPYPDSYIEMTISNAFPINGVFEQEEFKSVAEKKRTSVPSYGAFFTVENTTVNLTNTIECDPEVYKKEVGKTVKSYLNFTLDQFEKGTKGEKVNKLD